MLGCQWFKRDPMDEGWEPRSGSSMSAILENAYLLLEDGDETAGFFLLEDDVDGTAGILLEDDTSF